MRDVTAANLARQRHYRFVFVLPDGDSQFHLALRAAVAEAGQGCAGDRIDVATRLVPEDDAHAIARELALLDPARTDGVAIMAHETPQLRDAIAHLKEAGHSRRRLRLRSAEYRLRRFHRRQQPCRRAHRRHACSAGSAAVAAGSWWCRARCRRATAWSAGSGFDEVMAEDFPAIDRAADASRPMATASGWRQSARAAAGAAPGGQPGSIRSPPAPGRWSQALAPAERPRERPSVVVHELTPFAREALLARRIDAVITQDVGHLARSALRILRARCDGLPTIAAQERIRIEIILRENLP